MLFKIPIITKPKRIASLLGLALGDAITGGIAPLWVVDVYLVQKDVKNEEMMISSQQEQDAMRRNIDRQPLNQGGVRQATLVRKDMPSRPMNVGGARYPSGNMVRP